MKEWIKNGAKNEWVRFAGRTLFYFVIMVAIIYLYHYKNIQGGSFIYNEF